MTRLQGDRTAAVTAAAAVTKLSADIRGFRV
jgi:hypothetical protein